MVNFSIILTGLFPRSELLVSATRDFDRGRITKYELRRTLYRQQAVLSEFQKKVKTPFFSDGLLNWQDHFRPLADLFSGIKPGTLMRFADTNTFYRQPRITGLVKYKGKGIRDFFRGAAKSGDWVATLPAPFYFARLADDMHYRSVKKLTFEFTAALGRLIEELAHNHYQLFILYDPYIGYWGVKKSELRLVYDSLQELVKNTGQRIGYQTSFSCSAQVVASLLKSNAEIIGIDFLNTDIKSLPSFKNKKSLLAGCLDSRTTLVAEPDTLARFLKDTARSLKPHQLYATANIDLQFVPVSIAQKKLLSLYQARNL